MKVFTSGSDDMIKNRPKPLKTRTSFTESNSFNPKMKMREKTKLKTIEEIPLEELKSQVRDEGQLIIYCSHSYDIKQIINIKSYVENVL